MSEHIILKNYKYGGIRTCPVLGLIFCGGFLVSFLAANLSLAGSYPAWWTNANHSVITNVVATNDYAAVTAGQLKWFATNAYDELNLKLPNGAGTNVLNVITNFTSFNNYYSVNLGQLKNVAQPFYDRLIAEGYANQYPWTGATQTNDFAMANIGQLKNIFNFSIDTSATEYFVYTETNANNTDVILFSQVGIIGSTLRVTLWKGPDYINVVTDDDTYGPSSERDGREWRSAI